MSYFFNKSSEQWHIKWNFQSWILNSDFRFPKNLKWKIISSSIIFSISTSTSDITANIVK